MADERPTLLVDVVLDARSEVGLRAASGADACVLIEPLYGGPAVLSALDAGWRSVIVSDERDGAAPIPLVSFAQPPDRAAASTGADTCRVRARDLRTCALATMTATADAAPRQLLLATHGNLRPAASRIARDLTECDEPRLTIVCVSSGDAVAADAVACAGALCLMLLEEWDAPARLTDAAGLTTTIASTDHDPMFGLATGHRFARHIARGGAAHDATVAAQRDAYAAVAVVETRGDGSSHDVVATRLAPKAATS